jgi:hypothetical protein
MAGANDGFPVDGEYVVGEFIKTVDVTRRIRGGDRAGEEFTRTEVKLLLDGQYPRTVDFPKGKVPASLGAAQRGDRVVIPVYSRAYRDRVYLSGTLEGQE